MFFQAVSVVGRGDPVYSTSPVHSTYDGRNVYNYPTNPANYPMHAGFSPQPNSSYATQPGPVYSQGFGQDMTGGNLYHLVRPDHLQNIPTGAYYLLIEVFKLIIFHFRSCKPGPVTQVNPRNLPNPIIIHKRNRAEVCG